MAQLNGDILAIVTESLNNNIVIKTFTAEEEMEKRFGNLVGRRLEIEKRLEKRQGLLTLIGYVSDVAQLGLVFILGAALVSGGQLTIGGLVSFVTMTGSIRLMFELMPRTINRFKAGEGLAQRLYELLDFPQERTKGLELTQTHDYAVAEQLSLAYEKDLKVLKNINFTLQKGQKIAFVGPSGCGKSTLAKLLCLLYTDYEGSLALFGREGKKAALSLVREKVSLVSQDPYLFHGTLAENIKFGKENAANEEVLWALKQAGLSSWVETLPQGIHTPVGDFGSRLSGGQKQRVAIARALIHNGDLVLLDEATSALDTKTQDELQRVLDEVFKDKAVVTIAHRFAALKGAQRIYVMEKGEIAEQGTMEEMLADPKSYVSHMARIQCSGEERL